MERRWPESKELVPRTQGRGSVLRCTKCSVTGFAGWLDHVPHEGLCSFRREGRDAAPAPSAECGRGAAANLLQRCCLGLKHGTECRPRTLWVRVEGCIYSRQCVLEGGSLIPASGPCKLAGLKSRRDWGGRRLARRGGRFSCLSQPRWGVFPQLCSTAWDKDKSAKLSSGKPRAGDINGKLFLLSL